MENSKKRQRKRRSKKSGSSKQNADYKLKRQCALHSFFSYRRSEVVKQEDYPVEDIQQSFFATCKKTNYAYCFGCIRQLYVTTRSRIRDEASLISLSSSCPQYKFWEDVYNSRVAVATNGCITIPPDACICCRPTYPPLVETTVSYESKRSTRNDVGFWLAYNNPHSLVATPVGYHFDVFKGGSRDRMKNAQMENKIVLISSKDSNRNSMLALGRGGAGPSKFAYAILDHGTGERRAAWLDIYGEHYANEHNGDLPRQVNQRLIVEYLDREDVGVEDDVRDDFVNDHGPF